ncbi:MAG: dienelactone hydrolase [Kiritimatiellae bacterium]|nr:dienelactone hydrolase [Kiritimatiellia bacterium]MDD5521171.1 dienelactone hydrolase [Kiritimatiellia bacterium]
MNIFINHYCSYVTFLVLALLDGLALAEKQNYDPLTISDQRSPEILDFTVDDKGRQRDIPIRIYFPPQKTPAPVILFSHGLGGSREGCSYLGKHWAARGYVSVFLQHPGSDTSVWKNAPLGQRMSAMQQAAGAQNFMLRVKDVPAVIDQLDLWNRTDGHALTGRLDLKRIGMSGHSFGAVTTQAVSGQSIFHGNISFTDPRIKAAIAFSPSSPRRSDGDLKQVFGGVKIPWMLMTGTKDIAPIGDADMESRLAVFPALPPGGKYELVLDGAEHSAFTDGIVRGNTGKQNQNHHRAILALSTAFWDTWLRDDNAAKTWLDGNGPSSVLEKNDHWQSK